MHADARLRALYRLAEQVDGEELERVRRAIAERRAELEEAEVSAPPVIPDEVAEPGPRRWAPQPELFRPLPADAVPSTLRRPGERQSRVGTSRRPRERSDA